MVSVFMWCERILASGTTLACFLNQHSSVKSSDPLLKCYISRWVDYKCHPRRLYKTWPREMAQWLRVYIVSAEDPSSISNTHGNLLWLYFQRIWCLWPLRAPIHTWDTLIQTHTYLHDLRKNDKMNLCGREALLCIQLNLFLAAEKT